MSQAYDDVLHMVVVFNRVINKLSTPSTDGDVLSGVTVLFESHLSYNGCHQREQADTPHKHGGNDDQLTTHSQLRRDSHGQTHRAEGRNTFENDRPQCQRRIKPGYQQHRQTDGHNGKKHLRIGPFYRHIGDFTSEGFQPTPPLSDTKGIEYAYRKRTGLDTTTRRSRGGTHPHQKIRQRNGRKSHLTIIDGIESSRPGSDRRKESTHPLANALMFGKGIFVLQEKVA